jgi:hypothetical protein
VVHGSIHRLRRYRPREWRVRREYCHGTGRPQSGLHPRGGDWSEGRRHTHPATGFSTPSIWLQKPTAPIAKNGAIGTDGEMKMLFLRRGSAKVVYQAMSAMVYGFGVW